MRRRQGGAWRQAEKPLFDVQHLATKLKGNNVPMPSTLVRHLLRIFIPEIIQVRVGVWQLLVARRSTSPGAQLARPLLLQRRILPLFPKEFGEYMLSGGRPEHLALP